MKLMNLVLLALVFACGGSKSSNKPQKQTDESRRQRDRYSCYGQSLLCINKSDWFIVSSDELPKNFSAVITVTADNRARAAKSINTCKGSKVEITKPTEDKFVAHFIDYPGLEESTEQFPSRTTVEITDLGEDCLNNAIFYSGEVDVVVKNSSEKKPYSQSIVLRN